MSLLLLTIFIIPINILGYSDYIIPGGENIGIEVKTNGVLVVGLYDINGKYPAKEAGIKIGDIITNVDGKEIINIEELSNLLTKQTIEVKYLRNNKEYSTNLNLWNSLPLRNFCHFNWKIKKIIVKFKLIKWTKISFGNLCFYN